jgi:hypothetical protein
MRQVNEAELVWRLRFHLRRLSSSLRNGLAAKSSDTRDRAEQMISQQLVRGALGRYEILSDAPVPQDSDLFTTAAYGGGSGRAPSIDPED